MNKLIIPTAKTFLPAWTLRRILDEEQLLKNGLPGYREYTQKVPHRLVPYLW